MGQSYSYAFNYKIIWNCQLACPLITLDLWYFWSNQLFLHILDTFSCVMFVLIKSVYCLSTVVSIITQFSFLCSVTDNKLDLLSSYAIFSHPFCFFFTFPAFVYVDGSDSMSMLLVIMWLNLIIYVTNGTELYLCPSFLCCSYGDPAYCQQTFNITLMLFQSVNTTFWYNLK